MKLLPLRSSSFSVLASVLSALGAAGCGIGHSQAAEGDGGAPPTTCTSPNCAPTKGLPPDPGGPIPDGNTTVAFAIRQLYFGDTDRQGRPSIAAWKHYGLDIDGKITMRDSTDVCRQAVGASKSTQEDGDDGIDNSFGLNILPIELTTAGIDVTAKANDALGRGEERTTLILIRGLGSGPTYSPLTGGLFSALPLDAPASWNGNDRFPIDTTVLGPSGDPKLAITRGYMSGRVFVSGILPSTKLTLPLIFGNDAVTINHVQIAMTISPDGKSATNGVISGVLPIDPFIEQLRSQAGSISSSLCTGAAFDSIAKQIRQAQDILDDGTQDPSRACNAISIGLGFDATVALLGPLRSPPPVNDPCAR
jgi:hypothetical protein